MDNPVVKMQHLALEVTDIDRSIAFYRDYLGMKLSERHKAGEVEAIPVELCFMRLGPVHHDLVLVNNPAKKYEERPANPGEDKFLVFFELSTERPLIGDHHQDRG